LSWPVLYPQEHIGLAERIILSGGTLLSPFERYQEGAPWTFPTRNRLMAGISHATLIIEGREKSGTLITAGNAVEFGRDVMVVPGSIFSELSVGPHKLFKDGAIPVSCSNDILEVLGFDVYDSDEEDKDSKRLRNSKTGGLLSSASSKGSAGHNINEIGSNATEKNNAVIVSPPLQKKRNINGTSNLIIDVNSLTLDPDEKVVMHSLWRGAKNTSELIADTGLNPMTLNIILSKLELRGLVEERRARYHLPRRRK